MCHPHGTLFHINYSLVFVSVLQSTKTTYVTDRNFKNYVRKKYSSDSICTTTYLALTRAFFKVLENK